MRLVFAGTPEVAVPSLDAIAASDHELVGVVTRPDAPSGRGRKLVASPVAQRAEELGLPVLKPEHPKDPAFQEQLKALRSEEHTSELQSLMRISYAVFCLKQKQKLRYVNHNTLYKKHT